MAGTAGAMGVAGAAGVVGVAAAVGGTAMTGRATPARAQAGQMLRGWRQRRRLSQLELSLRAGVSTRHLSFVETGRAAPSRELVLLLGEHLDVPLRERNRLLLAAGYAPRHAETPLAAPALDPVRRAVRQLLDGHEPYPALVVDRAWNLVDGNRSLAVLTDLVDGRLLRPPVNVLRAMLHPQGLAPHVVDLPAWRAHLLGRLARQVEVGGGEDTAQLLAELRAYPGGEAAGVTGADAAGEIAVPLRVRVGDAVLTFISMVATFGTPLDVTVAELSIESFFPADGGTARLLRARHEAAAGPA